MLAVPPSPAVLVKIPPGMNIMTLKTEIVTERKELNFMIKG